MLTQVAIVKRYKIPIRGLYGQHLLIDPNVQRKIVRHLELQKNEPVLEIGPGLGALTFHLLEAGACVYAVERDKRFVSVLQDLFSSYGETNFKLFLSDILEFDFKHISSSAPVKVIGNLPYYQTTPILFYLFEHASRLQYAVLTVQKEVADRLVAQPGTKDYGRLTLTARLYGEIWRLFDVPRQCFFPSPRVDSTVIFLKFRRRPFGGHQKKLKIVHYLIQRAFSERRKTLQHIFGKDAQLGLGKEKVLEIFGKLGIPFSARGEELLLKDYLQLAEAFSQYLPKKDKKDAQ